MMFLFLLHLYLLFWLMLFVGVGLYSNLQSYPLFLGHLGMVVLLLFEHVFIGRYV